MLPRRRLVGDLADREPAGQEPQQSRSRSVSGSSRSTAPADGGRRRRPPAAAGPSTPPAPATPPARAARGRSDPSDGDRLQHPARLRRLEAAVPALVASSRSTRPRRREPWRPRGGRTAACRDQGVRLTAVTGGERPRRADSPPELVLDLVAHRPPVEVDRGQGHQDAPERATRSRPGAQRRRRPAAAARIRIRARLTARVECPPPTPHAEDAAVHHRLGRGVGERLQLAVARSGSPSSRWAIASASPTSTGGSPCWQRRSGRARLHTRAALRPGVRRACGRSPASLPAPHAVRDPDSTQGWRHEPLRLSRPNALSTPHRERPRSSPKRP